MITPEQVWAWLTKGAAATSSTVKSAILGDVVDAVEDLAVLTVYPVYLYVDATVDPLVPIPDRVDGSSGRNRALDRALVMQAARLYKRSASPEGVAGVNDFGVVRISRYDPDIETFLGPFLMSGIG